MHAAAAAAILTLFLAAGDATLVVQVEGLKDDQGSARAALYASEEGYPTKPEKAMRKVEAPIQGGRARLVFEGLPLGGYAVAVYHDENGNGRLDTGFLGIPTEGTAASNDAKGFMGPPTFEKARVEVGPGENRIVVHMSY
ncbi:MAG: DUF2141 domain-containing protein [Deltaproteobacteria bacterium]